MDGKYLRNIAFIFICLILLSSFSIISLGKDNKYKNDLTDFLYKQEINIPFDTNIEQAKYHPIDIIINFKNSCWGKDEKNHSIRVGYDDGTSITEIESQIYNIEKENTDFIKSCNLVFLIPTEANGEESYFVFYDSKETGPADYEDHIKVEDTHYFYEPISGQVIDIDYYGIWDDGDVAYAVCQVGELLGNPISQGVLTFKPGAKEVETYNIAQLGVFDMRYGIFEQPGYIGSSWAKSVKKTVLVDGNLMARVRIEGTSPRENIKTDNIFTFYHGSVENRKIFVDSHHEVLKDITVDEPDLIDGTFGGIVSIKARSATIEKMNVGEILPKIYLYNEEGSIDNFDVPQNPCSVEREVILSTQDDIDLGKNAWICLTDPNTGKGHGIIINSNEGINENQDGIQVKAWVKENIKLPGLEADTGNLYISRNSYEANSEHDKNLKKGYSTNYKAVFMSVLTEGFEAIDKESNIFQNLIPIYPNLRDSEVEDTIDINRYSLKCYVHFAPSFPMGSLLSATTGKKFPYIYAELYKNNNLKSSGSVSRLALGSVDLNLEGKKIIEKIQAILGIFDFKNSSFIKKIEFPDLESGTYLVKIFRENTKIGCDHRYIGYAIVDIKEECEVINIYCKPEASCYFRTYDQNDNMVAGAEYELLSDDVVISSGITNENGSILLTAPTQPSFPYKLRVYYQGFLVDEVRAKLGLLYTITPLKSWFVIDIYNLNLKIKDTWDFAPAVDVNPKITSEEMTKPTIIKSKKISNGEYIFHDLYSANYVVSLRYKSFDYFEQISVDQEKTIDLLFPAEYKVSLNLKDAYGNKLTDKGDVIISRNGKSTFVDIKEKGETSFAVPPGSYSVTIKVKNEEIASQNIEVRGDKNVEIISKKSSSLHEILLVIGFIILICSIGYMIFSRKIFNGLKFLVIGLVIISLVSPWWLLTGEQGNIITETKTILYPTKIITITSTTDIIGGTDSVLPEELSMVFEILSYVLIAIILLCLISVVIKIEHKKSHFVINLLLFLSLIVCLVLFYYAMSQVTLAGVGNFSGSGEILTTIPGETEGQLINCSWGAGLGFYLTILSLLAVFIFFFQKKLSKEMY